MTAEKRTQMDKEVLEPTDTELEVAALIEEIGQRIDEFVTIREANEDIGTQRLLEIDEKIERFVTLTKIAGNGPMGKAVRKRWRKIKQKQISKVKR